MLTNVNGVNTSEREAPTGVIPTRRERVRAATEAEILATARELVVAGGPASLTLREVGRRMGMTASALYRYVDGHAALMDRLVASFFDELTDALRAALPAPGPRPDGPAGPDAVRADILTASRTFRTWAVTHPSEFGLMFIRNDGVPDECPLSTQAGENFGRIFVSLFAQVFEEPLPEGDGTLFSTLPPALGEVFARGWIRLLGLVMVEVSREYEHTYLTLDPDTVFEVEMAAAADTVLAALRSVREGAEGH
jgi:AcrR family transcriptional regulator